jgi:hypothetical protein
VWVMRASTRVPFWSGHAISESNADGHRTGLERWLIAAPGQVRLLDS